MQGSACDPAFDIVAASNYMPDEKRGPIGKPTANEVLKCLRRTSNVDCENLTDGKMLDWKGWLKNLPKKEIIIGDGIKQFLWVRLALHDPNVGTNRCDFVALRTDGSAVRLHPHATYMPQPVYGNLADWLPKASAPGYREFRENDMSSDAYPATPSEPQSDATNSAGETAMPNTAAHVPQTQIILLERRHLASIPQTDWMSKIDVCTILANANADWEVLDPCQGDFQWWRFVAALCEDHKNILFETGGITSVSMCHGKLVFGRLNSTMAARLTFGRRNKILLDLLSGL